MQVLAGSRFSDYQEDIRGEMRGFGFIDDGETAKLRHYGSKLSMLAVGSVNSLYSSGRYEQVEFGVGEETQIISGQDYADAGNCINGSSYVLIGN